LWSRRPLPVTIVARSTQAPVDSERTPTTRTVSILEGSTFVVSDEQGDFDASPTEPHGLFHQDTRFLSRWRLTVDGERPALLSKDDLQYFLAQFFLVVGTGTVYIDSSLSVIRKRAVGNGFHEDLTVLNHGAEPVTLELVVEADADFADLFEVKDALSKRGEHYRRVEAGRLVLGYQRENYVRETWISSTAAETELREDGLRFEVTLEPQEEWATCIDVITARALDSQEAPRVTHAHGDEQAHPQMQVSLDEWKASAPRLETDWTPLRITYERSLVDLAALRFYPRILQGRAIPAAGLPWFMTIFGRDSLITSYQALPFFPELASTTLRVLAARQGRRNDDFRDEEPGKILHEMRAGELTAFEERPHSPYYGTADATPLFLVLLDEVERWTGDAELVRELERPARAALAWIDEWGDLDGDGYVEYQRRNETSGLENQCWKDSWDSIRFADGSFAPTPLATCEIQGYVYDAKVRAARLAREIWRDQALATRLEREAAELKRAFNEDFWLDDRRYFALALDRDKRQVDSLTSNIGHLLWSGIVDEAKAADVASHLLGPRLFSGWGVRTMAEGDQAHNPVGYHTGTVWPHDTSLIALGLERYGFREEASTLSFAMLEAAHAFLGRLPEAFAGYPRGRTSFPVEYPTACSPQAWATAAPFALLRAILGLGPAADRLLSTPCLPEEITELSLLDVPGRWGRADVRASSRRDVAAARGREPRTARPAAESARDLFDRLEAFLEPSELEGWRGRFVFAVDGVGQWYVVLDDGSVAVSEGHGEAPDCVIRTSEGMLLEMLRGGQNPMTAWMQGNVSMSGDAVLAERIMRILFLGA